MNDTANIERLLSTAFSAPIRIDSGEILRGSDRSEVRRFRLLEGPADAPQTVVVKRVLARDNEHYDPSVPDGIASRFFNDWAGLRFLKTVDGSFTPTFYAGDRDAGFVIMEDMGQAPGIADLLLGTDPGAKEALLSLASLLGRMHALTIGKHDAYRAIRTTLGPLTDRTTSIFEILPATLAGMANDAGSRLYPGADVEVKALAEKLKNPGPFLAFTHGDPCPDNVLITSSGMKLLDFESAIYRHALLDGVYGRIHFPTCWCVNRLPDDIPLQMEEVYRAELVKGCPEASDNALFRCAVIDACAYWSIITSSRGSIAGLIQQDREWGISTVRQRVLVRFDILSRMTAEAGYLEAIGSSIRDLATKLRSIWPAEADAMPYYPAFR